MNQQIHINKALLLVACERHDGMNDGQPSTLAAVDAEIFIEALREPRFNYAPSKEIKYSELVIRWALGGYCHFHDADQVLGIMMSLLS